MVGIVSRLPLTILLFVAAATDSFGQEVTGRIKMPEICSPEVIPAVTILDPIGAATSAASAVATEPHFIDQRGLRFEPRVVAMRVGEVLRFGNADPELHNVHIQGAGVVFNQGVAPAGSVEFVPDKSGVFRVVCDVHTHMRAFIVVGDSPWVTTCGGSGVFRFRDVPEGRYQLHVWHELGTPLTRDVEVHGKEVDVGTLVLEEGLNASTAKDRELVCVKGCEPWPLVLDRISVTLATSLDAAQRPGTAGRAVPLVQDAFYRDFEASGMGTAVRVHLGRDRATRIEELFRKITATTQDVVAGAAGSPSVIDPTREALLSLSGASEELNRKGVTERSRIFAEPPPAFGGGGRSAPAAARVGSSATPGQALPSRLGAVPRTVGLLGLLAVLEAVVWVRAPGRRTRILLTTAVIVAAASVLLQGRAPSRVARESVHEEAPTSQAADMAVPTGAPVRLYPIGLDVTRNHLRITPLWHRAVKIGANPSPAPGDVHLLAKIQATEGNPNGFAKGDWVPLLSIRYTITPVGGGPAVSGLLRPLVASDGPRYGANLSLPGAGGYHLKFRIEPPSENALGRLVEPSDGVPPWWKPFEVEFAWTFRPESH